ncbi:MAG: hypothetical protein ABSD62_14720 [Candidatus Limnocylindrales bacterium]
MASNLSRYYADHRWFVVGGLAAAVAAVVGIVQIRKTPTSITVTAPTAATTAPVGYGASDVLGAYGAGAAATAAGANIGAGLGQGGLDLAGQALAQETQAYQSLGGFYASQGGSLLDTIKAMVGQQQPVATPPIVQAPAPPGAPVAPPSSVVATIDPSSATRLIGMDGITEVVPTQSTYVLGMASTIFGYNISGGGSSAVHMVSQGGTSYWLLDRNIVSMS